MKKSFIINAAAFGMVAMMFCGCGKSSIEYCNSGMELIESNDYKGAIEEFEAQIEKNSDNRDAYRGLGIAYYHLGDMEEAAECFKTAIDKSGKKYDDIHLDSLKYYADCLVSIGKYEDAVNVYTTLIDKCHKDERAAFYYFRGLAYIALKDENNATLDFEESLKLDDTKYQTFCNMYQAFYDAGYIDRGESYLKRVLNSKDADNLLIGKTYYMLGDYKSAAPYLKEAIDDGKKEAGYYLAMTYEAQEEYVAAEELYQSYLSKNSSDASAYNQYGAFLINRGKYDTALVYIETGIELGDKDVIKNLLFNQAVCYEYLGDFDEALKLFNEYLDKYPDDRAAKKEVVFLSSR